MACSAEDAEGSEGLPEWDGYTQVRQGFNEEKAEEDGEFGEDLDQNLTRRELITFPFWKLPSAIFSVVLLC